VSDLTRFRDHCRRMGGPVVQANIHLSADERALFRALAREVDAYLAHDPDLVPQPSQDDHSPGLFDHHPDLIDTPGDHA
jgi:hypothetical protein